MPEQQLLENAEHCAAILAHVPDTGVRDKLQRAWSNNGKGRDSDDLNVARWNELVHELSNLRQVWLCNDLPTSMLSLSVHSCPKGPVCKLHQCGMHVTQVHALSCILMSGHCADCRQRYCQQASAANSWKASKEGYCLLLCLPTTRCGGLQKNEPLVEGTLLCAPQNWKGKVASKLVAVLYWGCWDGTNDLECVMWQRSTANRQHFSVNIC